jgi:DNA-binding GntR family transcriptional regulator
MPEGSGNAVPGAARAFSLRAARKADDHPAYRHGKPARAGLRETRAPAGRSAPEAAGAGNDEFRARPAAHVLADRLAVALVHHEPGWRLPRHSVLARRYGVSTAEVDAAISELVGRHLLRRLPDGQVHRISPAECLIPLGGVPGLRSRIDPMAGELTCRSRRATWRRVPENISWALRVDPAEQMCVVHTIWAAGGEPAASATTYLPGDAGSSPDASRPNAAEPGVSPGPETEGRAKEDWSDLASVGEPAAVQVELQQPPPLISKSLRLSAGQCAATITARFDDPLTGRPTALTVAVLRPELFRIVVQTAPVPRPGGEDGGLASARTAAGWES